SSTPLASSAPYTLSLHDALPISRARRAARAARRAARDDAGGGARAADGQGAGGVRRALDLGQGASRARPRRRPRSEPGASVIARDRKSTRLNSSHVAISYAVFCL